MAALKRLFLFIEARFDTLQLYCFGSAVFWAALNESGAVPRLFAWTALGLITRYEYQTYALRKQTERLSKTRFHRRCAWKLKTGGDSPWEA
jgi:hypothetical protein